MLGQTVRNERSIYRIIVGKHPIQGPIAVALEVKTGIGGHVYGVAVQVVRYDRQLRWRTLPSVEWCDSTRQTEQTQHCLNEHNFHRSESFFCTLGSSVSP